MPMTLSGLQEVGLSDWPAWYSSLNPGYFADGSVSLRAGGRRQRANACAGNGCCGPALDSGLARTRIGWGGTGGGRKEERETDEELGEQVLRRLRSMPREETGKGTPERRDLVSRNVLLERAAVKDTKDWEEESCVVEAGAEEVVKRKTGGMAKEKLVDV
jgi:hypothetical protein